MSPLAVIAPSAALVLLAFVIAGALLRARFAAVRAGQVKLSAISAGQRAWPDRAQRLSNALDNQFQLPVLFHVLVGFAYGTRTADLAFVALAWLFVALRLAHAWVYATTNPLLTRMRIFLAGALVLAVLWALLLVHLALP